MTFPVIVAPAQHVLIPLASALTGMTEKAIRRKIEEGVWIEGREWWRAPDGHIYVDLKGHAKWVESQQGG